MLAPKGFSQSVDRESYVQARLLVSKRIGALRFTVPAFLLAAIFVGSGVDVMMKGGFETTALLVGGLLFCVAAIVAATFAGFIPQAVKNDAARQFETYDRLLNPVTVAFTSEETVLKSDVMTRHAEFAKTRLCIETPDRFILITDEETLVLLEKAAFADREETVRFLRDVCARRYVKKGG